MGEVEWFGVKEGMAKHTEGCNVFYHFIFIIYKNDKSCKNTVKHVKNTEKYNVGHYMTVKMNREWSWFSVVDCPAEPRSGDPCFGLLIIR